MFLVVNVLLLTHLLTFSLFEVCTHEILKQCLLSYLACDTIGGIFRIYPCHDWEVNPHYSHLGNSNDFVIKLLLIYMGQSIFFFFFFWSLFSPGFFFNSLLKQTKLVQCSYYLHIICIVKNSVLWLSNIVNTSFLPHSRCMLGRS